MIEDDLRPGYVDTPMGRMHVVTRGSGPCLVLLHQTPRCWDEYRALMSRLDDYQLVVPDLPGHGASPPPVANTIEGAAEAVLAILDALAVPSAHVAGHHFGGLVAYHLAVSAPERVESLVLSSTPYIDAAERERRRTAPAFNEVEPRSDGGHLGELWQRRSGYLARPDPAVLSRYVRDVLAHAEPDRGHAAVAVYRSEDGVGRYPGPVLRIESARDPRAFPRRERIKAAFPQARELVIGEGDIATPETCPGEFAAAIVDFHRGAVHR
ncbi:alpha/beta fold hydrolase [Saccharomonospora sp. NPDC046836]|uniref:alpha/beta fold hydrolase n=1 Tax=Saccharomonospora sp. NPDC046836 TaxID=3156921 RepID=UPI0033F20224